MDEKLIAKYRERRIWTRRKFALFPGLLRIEGRHGGVKFSSNVPLDNIRLPGDSVAFRDGPTQTLVALPFILLVLSTGLWSMAICAKSQTVFWCVFPAVFLAMFVAPFVVKRTSYVQYHSTAGVGVFNIGQLGNSETEWKVFVSHVEAEIRRISSANQPSQPIAGKPGSG